VKDAFSEVKEKYDIPIEKILWKILKAMIR
jgi:hypothetical protein